MSLKRIFMVAGRDLRENFTTKGFWIGLLMMPVMFMIFGFVPTLIARQQPQVTFVVMDRAGGFVDVLDKSMNRRHQRVEMAQLQSYLDRYVSDPLAAGDTIKLFDRRSELSAAAAQISNGQLDVYLARGGYKGVLTAAKPYLDPDAPAFVPQAPPYTRLDMPEDLAAATSPDDFIARARPYLTGQKTFSGLAEGRPLSAAVYIPAGFGKLDRTESAGAATPGEPSRTVFMWANDASRQNLSQMIGGILNGEIRDRAFAAAGIDPARVKAIDDTRIDVTQYRIRNRAGETGKNQQVGIADIVRQYAPIVLCFLLFQALIFTVSLLLTNTIEEKSNRVIEILVSSMSPHELMIGKLVGCAAIGGMIIGVWVLFASVVLSFTSGQVKEVVGYAISFLASSYLLPAFLAYFVLAYLMFSSIFLTIGSLCNTIREAQNLLAPIMLVMMVPILSIVLVPRDPNGTIATVLSWIPLFAPIVMLARIAANPPLWEVIGTGVLMVVTAVGLQMGAGVVFKKAILRAGAPIRFREIFSILSSDL